jgi:hypothetical protein
VARLGTTVAQSREVALAELTIGAAYNWQGLVVGRRAGDVHRLMLLQAGLAGAASLSL